MSSSAPIDASCQSGYYHIDRGSILLVIDCEERPPPQDNILQINHCGHSLSSPTVFLLIADRGCIPERDTAKCISPYFYRFDGCWGSQQFFRSLYRHRKEAPFVPLSSEELQAFRRVHDDYWEKQANMRYAFVGPSPVGVVGMTTLMLRPAILGSQKISPLEFPITEVADPDDPGPPHADPLPDPHEERMVHIQQKATAIWQELVLLHFLLTERSWDHMLREHYITLLRDWDDQVSELAILETVVATDEKKGPKPPADELARPTDLDLGEAETSSAALGEREVRFLREVRDSLGEETARAVGEHLSEIAALFPKAVRIRRDVRDLIRRLLMSDQPLTSEEKGHLEETISKMVVFMRQGLARFSAAENIHGEEAVKIRRLLFLSIMEDALVAGMNALYYLDTQPPSPAGSTPSRQLIARWAEIIGRILPSGESWLQRWLTGLVSGRPETQKGVSMMSLIDELTGAGVVDSGTREQFLQDISSAWRARFSFPEDAFLVEIALRILIGHELRKGMPTPPFPHPFPPQYADGDGLLYQAADPQSDEAAVLELITRARQAYQRAHGYWDEQGYPQFGAGYEYLTKQKRLERLVLLLRDVRRMREERLSPIRRKFLHTAQALLRFTGGPAPSLRIVTPADPKARRVLQRVRDLASRPLLQLVERIERNDSTDEKDKK